MTIVEKIKQSVEAATGVQLFYQSAEQLNRQLDNVQLPCAYLFLLENQSLNVDGGHLRERLNIAVFFVDKTEFDFESFENERIIDTCKQRAYTWLQSLTNDAYIRLLNVIGTQRVYDVMDVILTGFAVQVTIEEMQGVWPCVEIPNGTLYININGSTFEPVKADNGNVVAYMRIEKE